MTKRAEFEALLNKLYAARMRSDTQAVCGLFSDEARIRFAGGTGSSPIVATAEGIAEFHPLLTLMIKSFKLADQRILSMIIDGERAAVHWQALIHSRIFGSSTLTEMVDIVTTEDGRITSYTELLAPADR